MLQHLSSYLVRHKLTGLTQEDEPDKVSVATPLASQSCEIHIMDTSLQC